MYMFPEMIDMGLKDGQDWPTEAYKVVAQNLLLCNPRINSRTKLVEGVQKVLSIPKDKIATITFTDLPKYGFSLDVGVDI